MAEKNGVIGNMIHITFGEDWIRNGQVITLT